MKQQQHLFTNKMLRALLVPIIMEQLLNALMGTVDTMMVSNVDSINVLIIQAFSALAAGGTIICTQYLGQKNHEMANKSARQALFIITAISVFIVVLGLAFRAPLLSFIFGKVDADVMENSMVYFPCTGKHQRTDGNFHYFQCDEYCGKWNPDLGISYGSCRSSHFHTGIQNFLCSSSAVPA